MKITDMPVLSSSMYFMACVQAGPLDFACFCEILFSARFFLQGDKMKELSLPVPALNDREKTQRPLADLNIILL